MRDEDANLKVSKVYIDNTRIDEHINPLDFAVGQINEKFTDDMKLKL